MYKTEDLMDDVDVRPGTKERVEKWEEQIRGIQRRLGKNPSSNKAASLRYHLGLLIDKVTRVTAVA